MCLNSRDIEEIEREPFKEPPWLKFFVPIVRFLSKIPPIKKCMSESVGGLSIRIFYCWEKQDYEKATQIAIRALEKVANRKSRLLTFMDHHDWWSFMKHAVDSAKHIKNEEVRETLIEYANKGIKPCEGYDVAYCYLEFSRWKYHSDSYKEAVKYAWVASRADSTWAEPDFILGWYRLVLGTGKAEEHLSRAIEKDKRSLFRIANNEVCKQYPHIINRLKAKYHASEAASGLNEAIN